MTTLFEERERAAEALFALDEELRFLALARRNKMLGAWMCERLNLGGREAEAYKSRLVEAGSVPSAPGRTADEHVDGQSRVADEAHPPGLCQVGERDVRAGPPAEQVVEHPRTVDAGTCS